MVAETWDLDSIVGGGPSGAPFREGISALETSLRALLARADALPELPEVEVFARVLLDLEEISVEIHEINTFAGCHVAADAGSMEAMRAEMRSSDLANLYDRAWVVPNTRLAFVPDDLFARLVADPSLSHMEGLLKERRAERRFRLSEKEDALANELARDGILAWGQLYDAEVGGLRIAFDRGNGPEPLSPGQLFNLFSNEDPKVRNAAFAAWTVAWKALAPRAATILTHLTGTREVLNDRRGLDPLEEPLAGAKIERRTLDAMWEAARRARPLLHRYLSAKAKGMGKATLTWADTMALLGKSEGKVDYGDAQKFVREQFAVFSPKMAAFADRSFENRWIEVEDRPGKRAGGFCAYLPKSKQSRIFMTWGGTGKSVATLAHELGHAWHGDVLHQLPVAQRRLPMTLAETASTFGELLVREATMAACTDDDVRLRLLDDELGSALAFLANIPARFEMELGFYRMRREGPLDAEKLAEETRRIFAEWYGPTVPEVDAYYWANKLHFFIGSLAFYNFPYTFGYLFSALVYAHYRPRGAEGAPGYDALLALTGDKGAEEIARETLGLDLGDPETWMVAIKPLEGVLEQFEALVERSVGTSA